MTKPHSVIRLIPFAIANTLLAGLAHAANTQANCDTVNYESPIDVDITPRDFDVDPDDWSHYINNTNYQWYIQTNTNVRALKPHLTNMDIERSYDYLSIDHASGVVKYTGSRDAGLDDPWPLIAGSGRSWVSANWHTDGSVNKSLAGIPHVDQVSATCLPTQATSNSTLLTANQRRDGILIKSNDILYFKITQDANINLLLVMNRLAGRQADGSSADFTMWASATDSMPGPSSFTWSSATNNASGSQAIDVPISSTSRTVYFSVMSRSGSGHFALFPYEHRSSERLGLIACVPGNVDASARNSEKFPEFFRQTSLRFLTATQGNVWINSWWVFTNHPCDSSCNVCTDSATGVSGFGVRGGIIKVPGVDQFVLDASDPALEGQTMNHELGHWYLNVGYAKSGNGAEEYYSEPNKPQARICGHTLMNGPSNSNYFCSAEDHCKDQNATTLYPAVDFQPNCSKSDWDIMNASGHIYVSKRAGMTSDPSRTVWENGILKSQVGVFIIR